MTKTSAYTISPQGWHGGIGTPVLTYHSKLPAVIQSRRVLEQLLYAGSGVARAPCLPLVLILLQPGCGDTAVAQHDTGSPHLP